MLLCYCRHHKLTSPMSPSAWLILRPRDTSTQPPLPHCCCLSVVHSCPPSVIRSSLLMLLLLGTVWPNVSRPHPLWLFSKVTSSLPSLWVPSHDFHRNICSACAVTAVIFRQFNRSFYLDTYLHYCTAGLGVAGLMVQGIYRRLCFSVFISSLLVVTNPARPLGTYLRSNNRHSTLARDVTVYLLLCLLTGAYRWRGYCPGKQIVQGNWTGKAVDQRPTWMKNTAVDGPGL